MLIKDWFKEHWFKASCAFCALLVSTSAAYYFVIFLPSVEKQKLELAQQAQAFKEKQDGDARLAQQQKGEAEQARKDEDIQQMQLAEEKRQKAISSCLLEAEKKFQRGWDAACAESGKPANCKSVGGVVGQFINMDNTFNTRKAEQENCYKRYSK